MKKFLSVFLCVAMLLSTASPAFALDTATEDEANIIVTHYTSEVALTAEEIASYARYDVDVASLAAATSPEGTICENILALCTLKEVVEISDDLPPVEEYSSDILAAYIPYCQVVTAVSYTFESVYVFYEAIDNCSVILCYNGNDLASKAVYDNNTDCAFTLEGTTTHFYNNFRQGTTCEMSDEFIDEIYELVAADDWDTLLGVDEIFVSMDEDGTIFITPAIEEGRYALAVPDTAVPLSFGFQTKAEALQDLKGSFPTYERKSIYSTTRQCNYLGRAVSIKVTETRDTYVQKKVHFTSFAVGTTLTAIASAMGWPTMSVAEKVLTGLSIFVGAGGVLQERCQLCDTAGYTYYAARYGCVYDSFRGDYVQVTRYAGSGEFTGGYASNGEFTWIISQVPATYNHEPSSIVDTTIYNYNSDLVVNGGLTSYPLIKNAAK